ncbi:hypothetical protein NA57DRAFT_64128 [Rhizodiscina lignyota]|uniref:DNA-directed RNA polymerase subunit n=1 Tax=Rhizodiscina lignyota TaxID=1504668 RepID=A0A9P4M8P6_9PEZI|nr:hypothetical protein NA57DRAFT_64128 [Rhizodiscina lignyota]
MLLFCPNCSNMLLVARTPSTTVNGVEDPSSGQNRFECRTCPYAYALDGRYFERKFFRAKVAEDVVGGSEGIKDRSKTTIQCTNEKCDGQEALFYQLQIRSADEPMTNFYQCVKCKKEWRD